MKKIADSRLKELATEDKYPGLLLEETRSMAKELMAARRKFIGIAKRMSRLGRKGGRASAEKLTDEQRKERSMRGVRARWRKLGFEPLTESEKFED